MSRQYSRVFEELSDKAISPPIDLIKEYGSSYLFHMCPLCQLRGDRLAQEQQVNQIL